MSPIIVVDDDPHIRELGATFLRDDGHDVCEAADGVAALALLDSARVDLVVLDIMMPKMDGWELCRRIREHHDLPLLKLTPKGETSQRIKGLQLGADDYLVKPAAPASTCGRGGH